jgi:hypothetical protein
MTHHAASADLDSLVGTQFPPGEYVITHDVDEAFRSAVNAPPGSPGRAHPTFCHLATHVGKGVTFAELAELVGSSNDAGFLFGGGSFTFHEQPRIGRRYLVRGGITAAEPRIGARTGRFDVITTSLDLVDPDTDAVVATSVEHYICPREEPSA